MSSNNFQEFKCPICLTELQYDVDLNEVKRKPSNLLYRPAIWPQDYDKIVVGSNSIITAPEDIYNIADKLGIPNKAMIGFLVGYHQREKQWIIYDNQYDKIVLKGWDNAYVTYKPLEQID